MRYLRQVSAAPAPTSRLIRVGSRALLGLANNLEVAVLDGLDNGDIVAAENLMPK
jgi:hypothetical protein